MSTPILEIQNLSVVFKQRKNAQTILDKISLKVYPGEIVGLVGESGAGKSMTGSSVLGLIDLPLLISEGAIIFEGRRIEKNLALFRGSQIAMVFQDPLVSLNPLRSIGDQLIETIRTHIDMGKVEAKTYAKSLLKEVGIEPDRFYDYPHTFSGGMRQRVVIALALAPKPKLIIADEPTTALDVSVQAQILDLLRKLCKERDTAIILITHDMGVIAKTTERVAVLNAGKLVETGKTYNVLKKPKSTYTKKLIDSTPTFQHLTKKRNFKPFVQKPNKEKFEQLEYLAVNELTKFFDLSDPWLVRQITGTGKRILKAVEQVSFKIDKGRTYALVGESGSGKTTIAQMVAGILQPSAGSVKIDGKDFTDPSLGKEELLSMRRAVQMIFQSPYASLNPRWRVGDIIKEPLDVLNLNQNEESKSKRVIELIEQVGLLPSDVVKFPHEFSGGQRQRICIARALASRPELIICDEPTSALDVSVQAQVLRLLKDLQKEFSITYLFISHDLAVVSEIADKIGVLKEGVLIEEGTPEALFSSPVEKYTKMLIAAAPDIGDANKIN